MGVINLRRPVRRLGGARNIGLAGLVAGFALIVGGWYGAARVDFTQGQIPYVISGGIGGLGLILAGAALLLIDERRRQTATLLDHLDRASEHRAPVPGDVLLGTTVYHRTGCRLVAGRDLPQATPTEAADRGLSPCRICQPDPVEHAA